MISLAKPSTSLLQAQIGEGLAAVASYDFPHKWSNLVDVSQDCLTRVWNLC